MQAFDTLNDRYGPSRRYKITRTKKHGLMDSHQIGPFSLSPLGEPSLDYPLNLCVIQNRR